MSRPRAKRSVRSRDSPHLIKVSSLMSKASKTEGGGASRIKSKGRLVGLSIKLNLWMIYLKRMFYWVWLYFSLQWR